MSLELEEVVGFLKQAHSQLDEFLGIIFHEPSVVAWDWTDLAESVMDGPASTTIPSRWWVKGKKQVHPKFDLIFKRNNSETICQNHLKLGLL